MVGEAKGGFVYDRILFAFPSFTPTLVDLVATLTSTHPSRHHFLPTLDIQSLAVFLLAS